MTIVFWYWWILAAVLAAAEILGTGFYLLWTAAAAVLLGFLVLLFPGLGWEVQLLLFALSSLGALLAWHWFQKRFASKSDSPALNLRAESYLGRRLDLEEPIVNGFGTVRLDDSRWRVEAEEDLPSGTKVKVIGCDGATLKVARA